MKQRTVKIYDNERVFSMRVFVIVLNLALMAFGVIHQIMKVY